MTFAAIQMLGNAGWMAAGVALSLGVVALAQRIYEWRRAAGDEWDSY